jgi:hypothetical protein
MTVLFGALLTVGAFSGQKVYGGGFGGLLLLLAKKFGWECGSFVQVVQGVHLPGSVPFKVMLFVVCSLSFVLVCLLFVCLFAT